MSNKSTKEARAAQHTPGPWVAAGCTIYQADAWKDGNNLGGRQIARAYPDPADCPDEMPSLEDVANTDFIVRACNAHYELLAACKRARECIAHLADGQAYDSETALREVEAAIAKAEGRPEMISPKVNLGAILAETHKRVDAWTKEENERLRQIEPGHCPICGEIDCTHSETAKAKSPIDQAVKARERRLGHNLTSDFSDGDCGGVFDGTRVISDADPGM